MAKNDLPVDKINKLAEILKEQDLTEIELESDDLKIKVRKEASSFVAAPVASPVAAAVASSDAPAAAASSDNFIEIKSPMVGTFYSAPSPDAEAFIKVGDKVKKGDVICIVEAMKLMNELPSEVEGEVVEICVQNGEAVSFGQVIAKLK
jgi:acetyl-CoA carboxylase biotin carboxyl carrier protein